MHISSRRIAGAVAVLVAAVGVYLAIVQPWSKPRRALPALPHFAQHAAWFREQREYWSTLAYTPLSDDLAVQEVVREWVGARSAPGPEIDAELLVRDVCSFLRNMHARSADEYLAQVGDTRRLRTGLADDKFTHACYNQMTGGTIGAGADPVRILAEFWEGHPQAVARPVAIAREGCLDVGMCMPRSERIARYADEPIVPVFPAGRFLSPFPLQRQDSFEKWVAPTQRGLIRVTEPARSFEAVLTKHDAVPLCSLNCIVRSSNDRYGILSVLFYFSPDDQRWYLESGSTAFGTHVFWPV